MGIECCGENVQLDEELKECKNINAIKQIIIQKKSLFPSERLEITRNIDDPEFFSSYTDLINYTEEDKRKRIAFLEELEKCYQNIIVIFNKNKNPKINLRKVKILINNIMSHYYYKYDENKDYEKDFKIFKEYMIKQNQINDNNQEKQTNY